MVSVTIVPERTRSIPSARSNTLSANIPEPVTSCREAPGIVDFVNKQYTIDKLRHAL